MCESEMHLVSNVLLHSANANKIKVMKIKLSPASLQETIKETRPDRFPPPIPCIPHWPFSISVMWKMCNKDLFKIKRRKLTTCKMDSQWEFAV